MQHPKLSPAAQRVLVDGKIRQDLVAFIRKTFETVVPGEILHLNWHIQATGPCLERGPLWSKQATDDYFAAAAS